MVINFANIGFEIINDKIFITQVGNFAMGIARPFAEV